MSCQWALTCQVKSYHICISPFTAHSNTSGILSSSTEAVLPVTRLILGSKSLGYCLVLVLTLRHLTLCEESGKYRLDTISLLLDRQLLVQLRRTSAWCQIHRYWGTSGAELQNGCQSVSNTTSYIRGNISSSASLNTWEPHPGLLDTSAIEIQNS